MNIPNTIQIPTNRPQATIRLDANESPFNTPDNRYPSMDLNEFRTAWGLPEHIPASCLYFTSGTEEAIDLSMRIYAMPNRDSVVSIVPTRSVYYRRALINHLEYREASLGEQDFSLNAETLLDNVSQTTKMIFLCSPNSPTGNVLQSSDIELILQLFNGMVVVDESYVDYTPQSTVLKMLNNYSNLIILRSFSHAWSSAGLRLAAVIARPNVITDFQRIGYVHPISSPVVRMAKELVNNRLDVDKWIRQIISERTKVASALKDLPECEKVFPSETNFLLVRFTNSHVIYAYLLSQGIAVKEIGNFLRITIGLPHENSALLGALRRRV